MSEGEGLVYDYASYGEGSSRIGRAGDDLTATGDGYAAVQGRASAQLRPWQPAVPVADALDQVEAKLAEATRLGAADMHWTSGQLTAARDTMLKAAGDNTALAQRATQDLRGGDLGRLDGDGTTAGESTGTSGDGGPPSRISQLLNGGGGGGEPDYEYNMIENPGPLADLPGNPAANFAGGRYNEVTLDPEHHLLPRRSVRRAAGPVVHQGQARVRCPGSDRHRGTAVLDRPEDRGESRLVPGRHRIPGEDPRWH